MSLIDRIKKARAKAEKLKAKSETAKSKGKDNRSTNLERRSKNKSEKANKLGKKMWTPSSFMMGSTFGTGESMQDTAGEKTHTFKKSKSGPKDTSYKPTPAPYHGNTKDTGGKPPKSINKKNKK